MNLYFLRHGETLYNKMDILQGLSDSPLLKEAKETSEKMGQYFQDKNIDLIYCSPLKRAKDTAEIINKYLKKELILDKRLIEISYGDFEEKKRSELKKLKIWSEREKNKFEFIHPGSYKGVAGQSYKEKCEKLKGFIEELLSLQKNSVVIGHLSTCMAARNFFNRNPQKIGYLKQRNNEIYHIEFFNKEDYREEVITI